MKYFLDAVVIHQKCNDSFEAKMPVVQHFFPCTAQNRTENWNQIPFFFYECVGFSISDQDM